MQAAHAPRIAHIVQSNISNSSVVLNGIVHWYMVCNNIIQCSVAWNCLVGVVWHGVIQCVVE